VISPSGRRARPSPWYLDRIVRVPPHGADGAPRIVAEGKYLRFVNENGWEYVLRPHATGVVAIVALTGDHRLILVEQYRVAVHRRVIELPAGLVGDSEGSAGESLAAAARRELLEETGYEADDVTELAAGPVAVGLAAEVVTFFHARGLRRVGPGGGDATEEIVVHEVELQGLRAWLADRERDGAMVDPKIFAGLYLVDGRT
jgi:ADP-ribose pyrophosphatase